MELLIALYVGCALMLFDLMRSIDVWWKCKRYANQKEIYGLMVHCHKCAKRCIAHQMRVIAMSERIKPILLEAIIANRGHETLEILKKLNDYIHFYADEVRAYKEMYLRAEKLYLRSI